MTTNESVQSAAPDELAVRLARLGLPTAGAKDRQAALPGPLPAFHRALLGTFLTEAGPPDLTVLDQLAAELGLDPRGGAGCPGRRRPGPHRPGHRPRQGRLSLSPDRPLPSGWSWPTVQRCMPCAPWTPLASPKGPPQRADQLHRPHQRPADHRRSRRRRLALAAHHHRRAGRHDHLQRCLRVGGRTAAAPTSTSTPPPATPTPTANSIRPWPPNCSARPRP
jgi:hypothetical protein